MSASAMHNQPEFMHAADMEWEMGRFGNVTKFLSSPTKGRLCADRRGAARAK